MCCSYVNLVTNNASRSGTTEEVYTYFATDSYANAISRHCAFRTWTVALGHCISGILLVTELVF